MDKNDYIEKIEDKLKYETTYKGITKDPTNGIKEEMSKK